MEDGAKDKRERKAEKQVWQRCCSRGPVAARGGGTGVNISVGGGAGYTKKKARQPAGKGKKQQGQLRPADCSIGG
jgi:hypothetical protein